MSCFISCGAGIALRVAANYQAKRKQLNCRRIYMATDLSKREREREREGKKSSIVSFRTEHA